MIAFARDGQRKMWDERTLGASAEEPVARIMVQDE